MRNLMLEIQCPMCGALHYVTVDELDFERWQMGALAQDAFPYLDATEREQLISQLCPLCQDDLFAEEDEGEDVLACELDSLGYLWW